MSLHPVEHLLQWTNAMVLWSGAFLLVFLCVKSLSTDWGIHPFRSVMAMWSGAKESQQLDRVCVFIREMEETLHSGILPALERWDILKTLNAPWGALSFQSVSELRAAGAPVLPTLQRLRELADAHRGHLLEARTRSAQAVAQAVFCILIIPVFGVLLYLLLPGLDESASLWGAVCGFASLVGALGGVWMLRLIDEAKWAGLHEGKRHWILLAQVAGERFLALVRGGMPADLAWVGACQFLSEQKAGGMALIWQADLLGRVRVSSEKAPKIKIEDAVVHLAEAIKRAIHLSQMEGCSCGPSVEAALSSFRLEVRACIDRELQLLPTRVLKPLLLLIAPATLSIMGVGFLLAALQSGF